MAVVQISRIQVRRGQKQVTGMPQLASGEIAWAIDTQELYIGNGAVFEGSPGVGNTKILTQNDLTIQGNLLNLLQHIYRANDAGAMQTGSTANNPTSRSVQDRLDDHVNVLDFGAKGDGVTDDTAAIQRAINQLFFNDADPAYADNYLSANPLDWNKESVMARRILEMPAGKYIISATILIPSYATIVGAGADKTILQFSNASTAIKFINDEYPSLTTLAFTNQARFIAMGGMTVYTNTANQIALDMHCVRDSLFTDLILRGSWTAGDTANSVGIKMTAFSELITCERNLFKHVTSHGFARGVSSAKDINNNTFQDGYMYNVLQGFSLGFGMIGGPGQLVGERYGPRKTIIVNYNFENVKKQAVYVGLGVDNVVKDCKLSNVGQSGGGIVNSQYPQIYFNVNGNVSENNSSDRWASLHNSTNIGVQYVPEVSGWGTEQNFGSKRIDLGSGGMAFRLPVSTDSEGVPRGSIIYAVDYIYQSRTNGFTRRGVLTISANINQVRVQLSDDYDFAGASDPSGDTAIALDFSTRFLNSAGVTTTSSPYSIAVDYVNALGGDTGYLTFTYKAIHSYLP
jgi:hypothetical protein